MIKRSELTAVTNNKIAKMRGIIFRIFISGFFLLSFYVAVDCALRSFASLPVCLFEVYVN